MPDGYGEALISLAEARAHLRVDTEEEDALIAVLRDAAIDSVERHCGLFLGPREDLSIVFSGFPRCAWALRLPFGPYATITVTAVEYADRDGVATPLSDGEWRVLAGGRLAPAAGKSWPVSNGDIVVTCNAGFAAGEAPAPLIAAAKLMLGHLYLNREAVSATSSQNNAVELPLGYRPLCAPFRLPVI
ncbi:phage head-tail connector protein [Sphingomonas canadensis]|uniref:Phage head-tail connector protein n=1 Tax=Sphingomonas canadensis TaxID=1219257 RepID=A0ABW3HFP6_9SPHN|nr:phage head-tail connector protein [Sphingomonas canadensis]MCW3837815.1 phage head-tail connector protein [Sphingomonas canadensis]